MNTQLEYLGEWNKWRVYKNSEGFLEGYKSSAKKRNLYKSTNGEQVKQSVDSERVVTNATDMGGFIRFVNGMKPVKESKVKQAENDQKQMKLFNDDLETPL